jgi:AraC-like DNA-binding protein
MIQRVLLRVPSEEFIAEEFIAEDFLQVNAPERPLRGLNTLISAARTWHSPHVHVLPMSIKFAVRGEIDVETRTRAYRLSNRRFLILNAWEPYTFQIPSRTVTQTLSLFFRPRYLASVQDALQKTDDSLLDTNPTEGLRTYVEFPEALFPAATSGLGAKLLSLFAAWQGGASQHCLADRVRDIAEGLIHLRCGALARQKNIAALRRSTREELYRRVQLAVIFTRENYSKGIGLSRVAREVGMSPHHLHRTFRAVNGCTVHQWIAELRLREAKRLLETTNIPIGRICSRVGYSSLPSFIHLFRSRFGQPPSAHRQSTRAALQ